MKASVCRSNSNVTDMKYLPTIAAILVGIAGAQAQQMTSAGFQLSLVPEVAIEPVDRPIHGLAINIIAGENPINGVALGLINIMPKESCGYGGALILNYSEYFRGVETALVNVNTHQFCGFQMGVANYGGELCCGMQLGALNIAKNFSGFQLGVFNYVDNLHGLQLGLINIATRNEWFCRFPSQLAAAFPIVNWSF